MPIMARDDKAPSNPMPLSEGQALSVSSDPQDDQNDVGFCHRRTRRCDNRSWPCQHHADVKHGPEPWRPAELPPTAQMRHRATDPMRQRMSFVHGPRRDGRGLFIWPPIPTQTARSRKASRENHRCPAYKLSQTIRQTFPFWPYSSHFQGAKHAYPHRVIPRWNIAESKPGELYNDRTDQELRKIRIWRCDR